MTALTGRRVIVTRERAGALAAELRARGAEVVHAPMIARVDPPDGGEALRVELARLAEYDWLIVTSPEGARRVGAAAATSGVKLAAVGAASAAVLAEASGREVDVVPTDQRASELAAAIAGETVGRRRMLLAQADLAGDALAGGLRAEGHDVVAVTAYTTVIGPPADHLGDVVGGADAVLFASGSAVRGWVASVGRATPPVVVVIGPSTDAVARELGIEVSAVAATHSMLGLVTALEARFA